MVRGISERMTLETSRTCTSASPYLRLYKLSRRDGIVAVAGYEQVPPVTYVVEIE